MPELKLKRLVMRNWLKFSDVDIAFPESGLVVVTGLNKASGGSLLSIGTGKTGIGEAISRTLMGLDGRFTHAKSYSKDKKGNSYIRVESELMGKPLVVEHGFKCKELSTTSEGLRYEYDGTKVQRGRNDETRQQLVQLLGVTPLLARWSVFVDGDDLKFNKLGQADCVELLLTALRQPPWGQYYEASKKTLGTLKREFTREEAEYNELKRRMADAQADAAEAQEELTEAKNDYAEKVQQASQRLDNLRARIKRHDDGIVASQQRRKELAVEIEQIIAAGAEQQHKLEMELKDLQESRRIAVEERKRLFNDVQPLQEAATEARTAWSNYSSSAKDCPTCQRPMGTIDEKRLGSLKRKFEEAKKMLDSGRAGYDTADKEVERLNTSINTVQEELRRLNVEAKVRTLSNQDKQLENAINEGNSQIRLLELELAKGDAVPDDAVKAAQATYDERFRQVKKLDEEMGVKEQAVTDSKDMLRVVEYWNMAFSPYGIPNMVLREAVAPLNKEAKRLSALMTGGTIEVVYKTRRELSSGMEKAELVVEVNNKLGSTELSGNSKGESGLSNIIIAETISEVGQVSRRIGYRWYDEVIPNHDLKVCHSFYAYLKETAARLGILIFTVDHNPIAANYADYQLMVEKTRDAGGVYSKVYWK